MTPLPLINSITNAALLQNDGLTTTSREPVICQKQWKPYHTITGNKEWNFFELPLERNDSCYKNCISIWTWNYYVYMERLTDSWMGENETTSSSESPSFEVFTNFKSLKNRSCWSLTEMTHWLLICTMESRTYIVQTFSNSLWFGHLLIGSQNSLFFHLFRYEEFQYGWSHLWCIA